MPILIAAAGAHNRSAIDALARVAEDPHLKVWETEGISYQIDSWLIVECIAFTITLSTLSLNHPLFIPRPPMQRLVAAELGREIAASGGDKAKCTALARAMAEIGTPPPGLERDSSATDRWLEG